MADARAAGGSPGRRANAFAALRHPNYRLWFWGQMISLFGTWMQQTAQGFLIFQLTHSAVYLGYVGFASGASIWLLMLYGGVIADRFPRRSVLLVTQSTMMLLAFVLAALTFLHVVQPWHIILLSFLLGVANAFDAPARQAFVLELVDRDDLTNAIALNSTLFNTATALGPAASGLAYAFFGPGWCFTINGATFLAVIIALSLMKVKRQPPAERKVTAVAAVVEGVRYVRSHPAILWIIVIVGVTVTFGVSFGTLFPVWAVRVLGGDATTNGILQSGRGLGALVGALFIASLGRFQFKGRLLSLGTVAFPLMLLVFSFLRGLAPALAVLALAGAAQILVLNLANSLVQTQTADEIRGRVMSLYSLTIFGFLPIGALIAGTLASGISAPGAVEIGAGICLTGAVLVWLLVPRIRALP